jgi:hypothetical protein
VTLSAGTPYQVRIAGPVSSSSPQRFLVNVWLDQARPSITVIENALAVSMNTSASRRRPAQIVAIRVVT